MRYVFLILIMQSHLAIAETSLFLGAWSYHLNDEKKDGALNGGKYNKVNNLIALEHKGWIGGYFKNSYNNNSYFAGKMTNLKEYKSVDVGIMLGLVTGYTKKQIKFLNTGDVMFMFNFYISPTSKLSPSLLTLGPAVAFAPRWRFDPSIF